MASTALQMVVRRLQKKLSRGQPFPPSTRPLIEEDFDFERLIDSGRELESRLTPLLHSVELLKSEIRKEAELLEEETAALEALEANAQGEASKRKRTAKTTHDILFDDVDTKAGVKLEEFVSTDRDDEYKISEVDYQYGQSRDSDADEDRSLTRTKTSHRQLTSYFSIWRVSKAMSARLKDWARQWRVVGQHSRRCYSGILGVYGMGRLHSEVNQIWDNKWSSWRLMRIGLRFGCTAWHDSVQRISASTIIPYDEHQISGCRPYTLLGQYKDTNARQTCHNLG